MLEDEILELRQRRQADEAFRERYDDDPVGAAAGAGLSELAAELEQVVRVAPELSDRYNEDAAFRREVEDNPVATLPAAGLPKFAVEPFLRANAEVQGFQYVDPLDDDGWLEPVFARHGPRDPTRRQIGEL
jgi:hypothetical protein